MDDKKLTLKDGNDVAEVTIRDNMMTIRVITFRGDVLIFKTKL
jgi:hypothetical protein